MRTDAELVALSDAGYHEANRAITLRAGGTVEERDGMLLFASALNESPYIVNGSLRVDSSVPPEVALATAVGFFAGRGRQCSVITHRDRDADLEAAMLAADWSLEIELPGMVATGPVMRMAPPDGVALVAVDTPERFAQMVAVLGDAFGPEDPWPAIIAAALPDISTIEPASSLALLALVGGEPASASVGYALSAVAEVAFVGTMWRFAGRRLGELVTRELTAGLQEMTGEPIVLQSSPLARPLYERIGFRAVTSYGIWVSPGPGAALD